MKKVCLFLFLFFGFYTFGFKLTVNLKKGEIYQYSIKKTQALKIGNDKTAYRNNIEIALVFNVSVIQADLNSVELEFILKKGSLRIVSPLGINEFNTEKIEKYPENPFLAMLVEMKTTPLKYIFEKSNFRIVRIDGLEELHGKVLKNLKIGDKRLKEKIKKMLTEKAKDFKNNYAFSQEMFPYLGKDITLKSKIVKNQDFLQGNAKLTATLTYQVENITEKFVTFKINSIIKSPQSKTVFNGLEAISSLEGKQNGSLTVNRINGLPEFYSVKQSLKGVFVIKDTEEKFPVTQNSIIIVRFNKVN